MSTEAVHAVSRNAGGVVRVRRFIADSGADAVEADGATDVVTGVSLSAAAAANEVISVAQLLPGSVVEVEWGATTASAGDPVSADSQGRATDTLGATADRVGVLVEDAAEAGEILKVRISAAP